MHAKSIEHPDLSTTTQDVDTNYEGLDFGREELMRAMRATYDDVIAFITTPEFTAFFKEMLSLDPKARPAFVRDVLFSGEELRRRGFVVPGDILIQRSAFGDRRPT